MSDEETKVYHPADSNGDGNSDSSSTFVAIG